MFRNAELQRSVTHTLKADEERDKNPREEEVPAAACASQRASEAWQVGAAVHTPLCCLALLKPEFLLVSFFPSSL